MRDDTAVDQVFKFHATLSHKSFQSLDISDPDHSQTFPSTKDFQRAFLEIGGHNHFGILVGNALRGNLVHRTINGDATTESGHPIGDVSTLIRVGERIGPGHTAGIVVLDDHSRRLIPKITKDIQRIVRIGQVGFAGMLAGLKQFDIRRQIFSGLDHFGFAQDKIAVDQLVQCRFLTGIFTITQPL